MNSGSFFRLDLEASKVVSGVTFFEYIDLPDMGAGVDGVQYPIKLTITQERVTVFVHYYNDSDFIPRHTEEIILDLPFLTTNVEYLSATIKRLYNTVFPLSGYLQRLMSWRYDSSTKKELEDEMKAKITALDDCNEKEHDEIENRINELQAEITIVNKYAYLKDSQVNKDSYSSLFFWGLIDDPESEHCSYQLKDEKSDSFTRFLRKFILDFMFDLMHSDVFESSKFFKQMKDGLMNDFFFSSIVKKSEFYYYRRIIKNKLLSTSKDDKKLLHLTDCVSDLRKIEKEKRTQLRKLKKNKKKSQSKSQKEPITNESILEEYKLKVENIKNKSGEAYYTIKSVKDLYAEKLDEAEAEWINVITSPLADKHFSFTPEWFEDQQPRKKKKGFSVSDSWFVNPEEELARILFPLLEEQDASTPEKDSSETDNKKAKVHYLNSYELGELIGTGNNSSVLERNSKASRWFYRRFDFDDTFRIHLFKNWNNVFSLTLLVFTIVALIPGFWMCPRNIALFPAFAAIGFFITSIVFWITARRMKIDGLDDVLVKNRRKREGRKAARLSVLCGAIWAFLYCHILPDSSCWIFVAGKILTLAIIAAVALFAFSPRAHIINNIHILLPRLVASITAAWTMIVIGNDLVKEYLSWPVCAILSTIVFVFILYEGNKSVPNITPGNRLQRALELMLISFSISLIIGVFAVNILSPSLAIDAPGYIQEDLVSYPWPFLKGCDELTINVFPGFLVRFSFLAMFIGVFIQMIFEEKNVTEM